MQIIRPTKTYDVCIVGSGAGGGMAANVLCEAGADVVMLEAGGPWDAEKDSKMSAWPYDSPRRGAATPTKPFGEFDGCIGGWEIDGEPYTVAAGDQFDWFRARMLGGRTNHWGRISLRFGPDDFRRRSLDGLGDDWPITYGDLAPYYDKVESFIGVFGSRENIPSAPDGVFLPPPKPRCTETIIKKACDKLSILCVPSRLAILTKSVNGRLPCHYCGQCGRGCVTASNFSSSQVMIPPAMKTGKLTMVTGAMAREVILGKDGKAQGVSYIDKATSTEKRVNARAVVVAASACESARLLLNSKSASFPDGLANSSGTVGRYLTDSVGSGGEGYFPQLENMTPHNHDGTGGMHMYMPWWKFDRQNDFPRGYHIGWEGEYQSELRAEARMLIIVPLTVLLIFIILYTMYKSFKWAMLILVNVAMARIGGLLALLITGTNFSVSSGVGFLALFGVSVQTGVIMLEYINQLRVRGHTIEDSAVEGAVLRLRPIMMTMLVATLGLLPAAMSHGIGSDSQRPFAIVIVGGLIADLVMSIFLLPTLYVWIARGHDVLPIPEGEFEN